MRIPVFARGSNPRFDRPILRKSESYATQQVDEFRADWIDPGDHAKGIVCRGSLYFGPPKFEETQNSYALVEIPGVFFVPPPTDTRPRLAAVRAAWDWTRESDFLPAETLTGPIHA